MGRSALGLIKDIIRSKRSYKLKRQIERWYEDNVVWFHELPEEKREQLYKTVHEHKKQLAEEVEELTTKYMETELELLAAFLEDNKHIPQ